VEQEDYEGRRVEDEKRGESGGGKGIDSTKTHLRGGGEGGGGKGRRRRLD